MLEFLQAPEHALSQAKAQDDSKVCYAPRLTKQQAELNWQMPAVDLHRQVLAYNPWPVSFTALDGENLRVWNARPGGESGSGKVGEVVAHDRSGIYVRCADQLLCITELQFAGRKRCSAADALNARDLSGCILGHQ